MLKLKTVVLFGFKVTLSLTFTLLLIEIGLRAFPTLIPLDLLVHFNDFLRADIAQRQNLTNRWDIIYFEQDDGGPPLWVYQPNIDISWPVDDDPDAINTRTLDQWGFCNPPDPRYQLPTVDVIALGDSFTTCYAVQPQDTWSSHLAELTGLSVYNLGRIGAGQHDEVQILRQFGLAKSPRVVILNIYEGNDLRDALEHIRYRQQQAEIDTLSETISQELSEHDFIERYSYALNLFQAAGHYWQENEPGLLKRSLAAPDQAAAAPAEQINFRYDLVFGQTVIPFNPDSEDKDEVRHAQMVAGRSAAGEYLAAQAVREPLAAFVALSQTYDFIPLVTYTPSAYTAYARQVDFKDPAVGPVMTAFSDFQRNFLKQEAENLGFTFVDLTPALQHAAQLYQADPLLYFPYNRHLTPAGHQVIAQELKLALQKMGLN